MLRFSTLVAVVLALAGGGLLASGVAALRTGTPEEEVAAVKALPVVDAATWASVAPGTPVLVEGTITADAPMLFRDFVVVKRQHNRAREPGKSDWASSETLTPALALDAKGRVAVNADYTPREVCHGWEDAPDRERVSGFKRGDRVVASGRLTPTGLAADALSCGDVNAWYARVRQDAAAAAVLGRIFSCAGVALLAMAGLLVRRAWRKRGER